MADPSNPASAGGRQPGPIDQADDRGQRMRKAPGTAVAEDVGGPEADQSFQQNTGQPATGKGPRDHSGDRGQRMRKAPGTTVTEDVGGPGADQSFQQNTGQPPTGKGPRDHSGDRGQRMRKAPGTAVAEDVGGPGADQSSQQNTGQPPTGKGTGNGSGIILSSINPLSEKPTIHFIFGSNGYHTDASPLNHMQWKHLFNEKKMLDTLSEIHGAQCREDDDSITFTSERPQGDLHQWRGKILAELKTLASKICSIEVVMDCEYLRDFRKQWEEEYGSKKNLVTWFYGRMSSKVTVVILSDNASVLQIARERGNAILDGLQGKSIEVPLPNFDDHCFQHFIQPKKYPDIQVLHEEEDGKHTIKLLGPPSERDRAFGEISSLVATLKMEQVKWPEIRAWMSRTENQTNLLELLAKHHAGVRLVSDRENFFLMGPVNDVGKAQPQLKALLGTKEYPLSEEIWKPLMQSVQAERQEKEIYFIPKYLLLALYDPSAEQLKLAGPLRFHTQLLQENIKICQKKPAPEVVDALQKSAKNDVFITTRADIIEIEGPVASVQQVYRQLIAVLNSKTQHGVAQEEKLPQAEEIPQDRLVTLLLNDAVKNVVNEHLLLPGKNLEDVTWSVDKTTRHLKIICSDRRKRDEAEREIKNLFAERETILQDLDEAAADRLKDSWSDLVKDLHEFNDCCIVAFASGKKWVLLATFRDRLDQTSQRLTDLMQFYQKDQTVLTLQLSTVQQNYLKKACGKEVTALKRTVEENGGSIATQPSGDDNWQVEVTGLPTLVSSAIHRLRQLRDDVHLEDVADGAISCLTSKKGKEFVSSLEENYKCYIDIPEAVMDGNGEMSDYAEVVLAGGTTVSLQHGPLQPERVDLVALPVPVDLEKKTASTKPPEEYSKNLADLKTHVSHLREKVKRGKEKVLLVTPSLRQSRRKTALMAVPSKWYDGEKREKDFVRSAVTELMEMTMGEKCSSVAIEIPGCLPEKVAEKQILFGLREFLVKETEEAAPPTGIKTIRLFTSRRTDTRDLSELLGHAFAGLSNTAQRKIVVAAADKAKAQEAAHKLSRFLAAEQERNESLLDGEGAEKGMEKHVKEDVSENFPNLRKRVCTPSPDSISSEVVMIMKKLETDCSISTSEGRLFLWFPAEKKDLAFAVCQYFDDMVVTAEFEIPSLPSSTAHQNEYDEILVNAAGKFFPEMLRKVRGKKNKDGKFVFTNALSKADHNLISGLQPSEVQVKDGETEKAKTIQNAFPTDPDIYVEYLPSKKVVAVVVRKYGLLQTAVSRIKIHLGQMKPVARGKRQFTTQPGETDLNAREASPAAAEGAVVEAAEEVAEEATGADNRITLPGGLVIIPYRADIIKLRVDAIVNAANERLSHRGGVARAISDAAGPDLDQECQDYIALNGPIGVSEVCSTGPGRLPCTRVIHAVGPRWGSQTPVDCRQQLYDTVLNCCKEADKWDLGEIAMPAISSGIFGMPKDECTRMYCKALLDFDKQTSKKLKTVHFVDVKDDMPLALLKALRKEIGQGQQRTRPPEADVDLSQGCIICTENKFDQPVKLNGCNHVFCKGCIEKWFKQKPTCPSCNKVCGLITGTMPPGTMTVSRERHTHLAGFENCGCIVIHYSFYGGIQRAEHPSPGKSYQGTRRTAYLPDNAEGNKVLRLLQEAWNRKLTFTIGCSTTTGQENVVTWNDIHHKTSTSPGHPFGYPDPDYLTRVQEELAARGVTEESIKLAQSGNPQDFSQFYTPLRPQRPTRL